MTSIATVKCILSAEAYQGLIGNLQPLFGPNLQETASTPSIGITRL
jgi:hypothetical protein